MNRTTLRRLTRLALLLTLLLPMGASRAAPGDEVVELAAAGRIDALEAGVKGGLWAGTPAEKLAKSVLESDGLTAVRQFEEIVENRTASPAQKTLAQFHLYGYAQIIGDRGRMNLALQGMRASLPLAEELVGGKLPEVQPDNWYAVQIGAFGSNANALRLANQQSAKGYTVSVAEIKSGSRTLHAVWVGRFLSADEAREFGSRRFGREGKDFRVVQGENN